MILLAANKTASKSGHVSVVLSESTEHTAQRDDAKKVVVPLQSQAGSKNFKYSASSLAPGSTAKTWWADTSHKDGGAWIFGGSIQGSLVSRRRWAWRASIRSERGARATRAPRPRPPRARPSRT